MLCGETAVCDNMCTTSRHPDDCQPGQPQQTNCANHAVRPQGVVTCTQPAVRPQVLNKLTPASSTCKFAVRPQVKIMHGPELCDCLLYTSPSPRD
eukprot:12342596-Alexandrium_andersonii.AAC.1